MENFFIFLLTCAIYTPIIIYMIKKISIITVFLSLVFNGCAGNKIADAKAYLSEMTKVQNDHAVALEKAKDSKEVVAAINAFGEKMVKLAVKSKELEKKHGDLKDAGKNPELKAEFDKLKAATEKMSNVNLEITKKYMKDQAVMKAMVDLGKKMQSNL